MDGCYGPHGLLAVLQSLKTIVCVNFTYIWGISRQIDQVEALIIIIIIYSSML